MPKYSVVLFHSTAHAIRGEKVLTQANFQIKMIPTPRQLSSDCGMALRFDQHEEQAVAATLAGNKVPFASIHAI
jgi:hypothetical protein